MLLSHDKKFIFLKLAKTAGTSLEFALAPQLGKSAIVTPQTGEDYPDQRYARVTWAPPRTFLREVAKAIFESRMRAFLFNLVKDVVGRRGPVRNIGVANEFDHMEAFRVKNLVGAQQFNNYFKVAVCRNPYDQMISLYFWRMYQRSKSIPPLPQMSFDEWLASSPKSMSENQMIMTIDGEYVMDFVLRLEDLKEDLATLCSKLDFDYEQVLSVLETAHFKSIQRPKGDAGSRKVIISPESKAVIDFFMDWDFKTFGYEKIL
jgi:hypothetical protein